jgi:tripartite-type tricarboxylate transporter receptor subunit TctC
VRRAACAALALLALQAGMAAAQYPHKAVRVVVSTVPGPLDAFARLVMEQVAASLKHPFVIENKAGAGGNLAAEYVKSQPADGYTLLFAIDTTFTVSPGLYKGKLPFDPVKDFATIAVPVTYGQMLTVAPNVPAKTPAELVALAKRKPMTYASGGNGSPSHLTSAYFFSTAGVEMTHVPYKGTGQSVIDVLGGRVDALFAITSGVLPYVKDGRLQALAVSSARRSALAPEVPTVAELGYPGFDATFAYALMAPAGTPDDIVQLLAREVRKAMELPEVREKLRLADYTVTGLDSKSSVAWLATAREKWTRVIEKAGISPE